MIVPAQAEIELADSLQPGERVRFAARPDIISTIRTKLILWLVGIPLGISFVGLTISGRVAPVILAPIGLAAFAFLAAPIILGIDALYTLYAVTGSRAIIRRNGIKREVVSLPFNRMDETLEILETGSGAGHLYFASNMPAKMRDTDHTGKLAFRDVADVRKVAALLDDVRRETITHRAPPIAPD